MGKFSIEAANTSRNIMEVLKIKLIKLSQRKKYFIVFINRLDIV